MNSVFKKGKVLSLKANNVVFKFIIGLFKTLSQRHKDDPPKKLEKESIFAFLKGSMSLEASLVVPIFLLFLMTILMSIKIVRLQTDEFEALHQKFSEEFERCNGIISEESSKQYSSFTSLIPIGKIEIVDSVYGHSFSGFSIDDECNNSMLDDEYVFVTITGKKYHRDIDCSYIKVIPSCVSSNCIKEIRNSSGGKYYPCERCSPKLSGLLYYTSDGDRFHSSTNCSSLRRTVNIILLSEAKKSGYTPCSKCG